MPGWIQFVAFAAFGFIALRLDASAATLQTLHTFNGKAQGGSGEALVLSGDSLLGVTDEGGGGGCDHGCGVLFDLDIATEKEVVLATFSPGTGAFPTGIVLHRGKLFGTTGEGDSSNCPGNTTCGTIYTFDPATGSRAVLHVFSDGADGGSPDPNFAVVGGEIYGTATDGGLSGCHGFGCGTVFKVNVATGKLEVIHSFMGSTDGGDPTGGVVYAQGNLYGTTQQGGTFGFGNVYRINLANGAFTVLYSFTGNKDGGDPVCLLYRDGILYGTEAGGNSASGGIFKIELATGVESVVYTLPQLAGAGNLIFHSGQLLGTTPLGGRYNDGTVFDFNVSSGKGRVLHNFTGGDDGANPKGFLSAQDGAIYGITSNGALGYGTVYRLTP